MDGILKKSFFSKLRGLEEKKHKVEDLSQGALNKEYIITEIKSEDEELNNFLFSLGCYEGEVVTIISILCDNYVINIKEARYSIDKDLAKAIKVKAI